MFVERSVIRLTEVCLVQHQAIGWSMLTLIKESFLQVLVLSVSPSAQRVNADEKTCIFLWMLMKRRVYFCVRVLNGIRVMSRKMYKSHVCAATEQRDMAR
jgi:hypothetical protein